ncbi:hypothetical protein OB13_06005 [Pontibacter sp. HJ8]
MIRLFVLLLAVAALSSCSQSKTETDASVATAKPNSFGASFAEENVLSVTQMKQAMAGQDSLQATVTAEVVQSCQSKGCWMDVKLEDGSTMKVTFRDYGFFLPVEDLAGKTVVFTGIAKQEVISVDDQRHFAEDAGKSAAEVQAINAPKDELRFVADGVILK